MAGARAADLIALASALALTAALACSADRREGPCAPPSMPGEVGTLCGFAKPEDVEAVESAGVVLVTEQGWAAPSGGGSIAAVVIPAEPGPFEPPIRLWPPARLEAPRAADAGPSFGDPSCAFPAALDQFSPHGLASRLLAGGTRLVAVVRHGEREGLELFELTGTGRSVALRWAGCVLLPEDTAGNDAAFAPNGEIVVSNYVPTLTGVRTLFHHARAFLGKDSGDVLVWSETSGWRHLPHSAAAMPNGVAVDRAGAFAYVAASGGRNVYRVRLAGGGSRETIASFEGAPDNLSWSPSGTLLVALLRADPHGEGLCRRAPLPGCPAPWSLIEIDPRSSRASEVLRHDGSAIHSVTSASRTGVWTFFGSMAEDRIGMAFTPGEPRDARRP
jgi:hypothetical protein